MSEPPLKHPRLTGEPSGTSAVPPQLSMNQMLLNAIGNSLLAIHQMIKAGGDNYKKSDIEIEIRLGLILQKHRRWKATTGKKEVFMPQRNNGEESTRFESGIETNVADDIKKKLTSNAFEPKNQSLKIIRLDERNNRWEVDIKDENIIKNVENKDKIMNFDLALVGFDYDVRIQCSRETASNSSIPPQHTFNPAHWTKERRKKRVTYFPKAYKVWQVDYTEVDQIYHFDNDLRHDHKKDNQIELEFELMEEVKMKWLCETDERKMRERTGFIAEQLIGLLNFCIPSEHEINADIQLKEIQGFNQEIISLNERTKSEVNVGKSMDFLGSMPVNLNRQTFLHIQMKDYYITEKSDGVRFLLYVVPLKESSSNLTAILLNRAKRTFTFRGSNDIGMALMGGTILDGELVFNRTLNDYVFLIFDVLLWKNQSQIHKNFGERYDLIQKEIITLYNEKVFVDVHVEKSQRGIGLVSKKFIKKHEFSDFLRKTRFENNERIFQDGRQRHHKSDGFIFQPNIPYKSAKCELLLKWKWPELRSVDLRLMYTLPKDRDTPRVTFYCDGPDNVPINCCGGNSWDKLTDSTGDAGSYDSTTMGSFDIYRMLSDVESFLEESRSKDHPVIVEVGYDLQLGLWKYMQVRKDKLTPNYIDTVMGVFTEQAEAISIEELEYTLNAVSFNMPVDYHSQINRMQQKLLTWQRDEMAKKKRKK